MKTTRLENPKEVKQYNYFRSPKWDLNDRSGVNPKYDVGDPNGKPYICNIRSKNIIYMNCLLFGKDEEDIKNKIKDIIEQAKQDNIEYLKSQRETRGYVYDYYTNRLNELEEKLPLLTVTEADLTKAFKVGWAINDTWF